MRTKSILVLFMILIALPLAAQVQVPRVSPHASVSQTVGTTTITIDYHRPGLKGRTIWGGLLRWDKAWRMGANEGRSFGSLSFRLESSSEWKLSSFLRPLPDRL